MEKNQDIETWLTFSRALFSELMPQDLRAEFSGMTPQEHATIVDRQAANVDAALASMALASGEAEVRQVLNGLDRETVIVLCSRWAHYQKKWRGLLCDRKAHQWRPPDEKDLWRAILLSMLGDAGVASALRERLWPGVP